MKAKKAKKAAAKAKKASFDRRWRKSSGRVQKKAGSPFLAIRVPRVILTAYARKAKAKGKEVNELLREHMAKVGGVKLAESDGDE